MTLPEVMEKYGLVVVEKAELERLQGLEQQLKELVG